jgi:hypothetical protein
LLSVKVLKFSVLGVNAFFGMDLTVSLIDDVHGVIPEAYL